MALTGKFGVVLECADSFKLASDKLLEEICNGCGATTSKFDFVPDTIYGLDISGACMIHDWDYHMGKNEGDRKEADLRFKVNLFRLIDTLSSNQVVRGLRRARASWYFWMVRWRGKRAFYGTQDS